MSDLAPPLIYYIAYPLEDVIACEICNNDNEVRNDARRQRGVFKAASRRQNCMQHLSRQHDVPVENVKIRCSVCGRVSNKPSRTVWRDMETHHRRQHATRVKPVEVVGKVVEPHLVTNKAESSVHGQEKEKVPAFHRPVINDVDEQKANIFSAVVTRKCSTIKTVGTGRITATIKQEPKNLLPNKSMIIGGMGKMFDVVMDDGKKNRSISRSDPLNTTRLTIVKSIGRAKKRYRSIKDRSKSSTTRQMIVIQPIRNGISPRKRFHPA